MAEKTVIGDSSNILKRKTGVVIPVYLPEKIDAIQGMVLLTDTLTSYCALVDDPARVCLSVDGEENGADLANELCREHGACCCVEKTNSGKLKAALNGMQKLDNEQKPDFIAVVDQDGDHFANELLNFIRTACHITAHTGNEKVMVLGRRISRHRPMGYIRGELEELADRVLLDALQYRAALSGKPLVLEYAAAFDEFPDFHSGYKLFSIATARELYKMEPHTAGADATCYWRHACEAVMVVEVLLAGAVLGVVNRSTINEQPLSTFAHYDFTRMAADKMIWPCKRMDVPLPFVKQWLANHYTRSQLATLAPDGKELLGRIRQYIMAAYDDTADDTPPAGPLFV